MKKFIIDGKFLLNRITGIERYCIEIVRELDKIADGYCLEIVIPSNAVVVTQLELRNIAIKRYGRDIKLLWRQYILPFYIWRQKGTGIFLMNNAPFNCSGIVLMYDIAMIARPEFYTWKHTMLARFLFSGIFKHARQIMTVSEFSKSEILKYFTCKNRNIIVAYSAWQHYQNIPCQDGVLEKYGLKAGEYFFMIGGLSPNKNLKWLEGAAKNNPYYVFAASGSINADVFRNIKSEFKHLRFLGYLSDPEVKTLMKYNRAFVFPTFYEGFGLPPLEALSTGAKIIVSDTPVMREVYEDAAYYIDPNDYDVDMDALLREEKPDGGRILEKFSWESSAKKLLEAINAAIKIE